MQNAMKNIPCLIVCGSVFFLLTVPAFAAAPFNLNSFNPLGPCGASFADLFACAFDAVFWIALALAVLMFLIAAFFFMTAAGDPTRLKRAKDALLWALIGVAVVIVSGGLASVICNVLGGKNC